MSYQPVSPLIVQSLIDIVGSSQVHSSLSKCTAYGQDKTEDLLFLPEVIVLPKTVVQIQQIMRLCSQNQIPVTPRGAGTGLAGGALPVCGGIVLSMECLNQILEIDEANLQVTTEPAVITEVLQEKVQEKGLYYPPDPASRGSSFIGGNVATNSGGPRAVKYGVVKDYVLNLEVVLPNGDLIWTGANTLKNSTGYNLTQLMVGSEGTLGIITKIVLKLIPLPSHSLLMLVPFRSPTKACAAVSAIFQAGITPSCLEFMERAAIDIAANYLQNNTLPIKEEVQAHLIVEVDGNHLDSLYLDCEKINSVLEQFDCGTILLADDQTTKNTLWQLRRNLNPAIKQYSAVKKADTVVPRAALAELLKGIHQISTQHGIRAINYGHAGDGNLHVSLLQEQLPNPIWEQQASSTLQAIFKLVKSLNGTISGEHGIGWIQKKYMPLVFNPVELQLMRAIKKTFDPTSILNPSKIID
ncbi:FAD-binding oxidoreductase [Aureispira anguillae]|uniref:FAD-binding protein n=1 Tax=Aureispira anguillae TaxID=2864201 RepID=A0A915YAX4_9BACT|nr:FAD-linked oxidase C-terminal domain-containing protein [Aureispira anguillae]BDS09465.1 FAD-binding protein [Aureispira anguillae]